MDSDSELEEESTLSELEIVRDQLKSYTKLNADLSKKVQECKIMNNATNNELIRIRNELMAEQLKSSELRRALNIMNQQCSAFFNSYMLNLQKCIEKTDLGITMPTPMSDTLSNEAGCSSSMGQGAIQFRPIRMQQPNETNLPNLLNTIQEESAVDAQFHIDDPIVASTPFIQSVLRDTQNIQPLRASYPEEESEMIVPTPKRSSLPKRLSQETRLSKQRVSEETSSEEEIELPEQEKTYITARNNTRRENIAVNVSQDDDSSVLDVNQEETIAEVSQAELSISKYPLKELSVNVTKIETTTSSLSRYTKSFILPQSQVAQVQTKIIVEDEDEQDEVKENIREASIESSMSNVSSMSNFSISTTASSTSLLSKASRKRKAVSDVPRRSTGRPKRKARLAIASLAEGKLNRKLRRS